MNETKIKEEEIAAARAKLDRVCGLVSVPEGQDEPAFRAQLKAFVSSLPSDSAVGIYSAYQDLANGMESGEYRGLSIAGLSPADMILGALFAAQEGKSKLSAGDSLGTALPAQQRHLQEDRIEI